MFFCRSWPQKDLCSHVTGREGSGNADGWFQGWKTSNLEPSARLKSYGSQLDLGISGKKLAKWSHSPLDFYQLWDLKPFPWRNPPLPGNLNLLTIQTGTPHWMTCSSFLKSLCEVDSTSSLCWLEGGQFSQGSITLPALGESKTISILRNFPYNNAFFSW